MTKRLFYALVCAVMVTPLSTGLAFSQSSNSNANSGSSANSGAQAVSGNSWTSNSTYKSLRNNPSISTSTTTNNRTCAVSAGAGVSAGGFGFILNLPMIMQGCEVERAAALVRSHPNMRLKQKGSVYSQVLCQDKVAGQAMVASGETCLVGRYKNQRAVNVATVNYVRAQSGTERAPVAQRPNGNSDKMRMHCLAAGVRPAREC